MQDNKVFMYDSNNLNYNLNKPYSLEITKNTEQELLVDVTCKILELDNDNSSLQITKNTKQEELPKLNFDNFSANDLRKLIMYISNSLTSNLEDFTGSTKDKILLSQLSLELQKILKSVKNFIDINQINPSGQGIFKLIQVDWDLLDLNAVDYIKNKPTEVSQFNNDIGYTNNIGTLTGVVMNGTTLATSGVVDLGTVITAHQDLSGKQDVLVSGSNIKSVNGQSVLGSGDIDTLDAVVDEETETLILE